MADSTDVIERWVELHNPGDTTLLLVEAASAGFNVPTPYGARVSYQWGQWAQEFQLDHVDLGQGRFTVGSSQGVPGHRHVHPLIKEADDPSKMVFGEGWHTDSPFLPEPPAITLPRR